MAIKRNFSDRYISDYINAQIELKVQQMLETLMYIGNEVVTIARTSHKYKDQTGNLTSSIGYCVLRNGRSVSESMFEVVKNGQKGADRGRNFLAELADKHSDGIALIVVAGMEYAVYVNAKGLDVLDSAELKANEMIKDFKRQLKLQ